MRISGGDLRGRRLSVELEGKNREIRKVMEHLGLGVNRLIRISFGPFRLTDLEPGRDPDPLRAHRGRAGAPAGWQRLDLPVVARRQYGREVQRQRSLEKGRLARLSLYAKTG